jgi:DNA-binding beta-propeller fold protein YncE
MTSDTFVTSVYAVNTSLGIAVEIDPASFSVRRSAAIPTSATGPTTGSVVLAKFGHGEFGPVGRRVIAAPDGTTLFAAGAGGMSVIRTKDLSVVRTDLAGSSIDGLGITPDGATLFALVRGTGQIVAIDARTGHRLGTVPGAGYDRLLAIAPA